MSTGSQSEFLRDLAIRVAWESQIQGIDIDAEPAEVARQLQQQGYFNREDIARLTEAADLGQQFRLAGFTAFGSESEDRLSDIQRGVGLEESAARVPVLIAFERDVPGGGRTVEHRWVIVDAMASELISDIVDEALEQADDMVDEYTEPGGPSTTPLYVGIGPIF